MNGFTKRLVQSCVFIAFFINGQIPEFRPFRPGVSLIAGIKATIAQINREIDGIEYEAVGIPTLKDDLARANRELSQAKTRLGIAFLEMQIAALENQFDGFALRFFKSAQVDGVFLYNSLMEKIGALYNNPQIQNKILALIRMQYEVAQKKAQGIKKNAMQIELDRIARYKQEIIKIAQKSLGDIIQLGEQINIMTLDDQRGLKTIKKQIDLIKKQLDLLLENQSIKSKLEPYEKKVKKINKEISNLLAMRFTDDRLIKIENERNRMQQYKLLLEFLRNPASIQEVTAQKLLGDRF